jgi:hypothetical protein
MCWKTKHLLISEKIITVFRHKMTNLIKYLKSEKIKKNLFLSPLTTFLEHTWIHPMNFAGSVLLIFFDFLNFPFFIAPSIFFNVYFKSHFQGGFIWSSKEWGLKRLIFYVSIMLTISYQSVSAIRVI